MRNFLLLFVFMLGVASYAQRSGNVVIYSNTGQKFYVVLNGVRQNSKAETNVKVEGLTDQWYSCKVIAENNAFTLEKNIAVKPDTVITYRIIEKKGDYKLRYYSESSMGTAPADPAQTVIVYVPVEQTGTTNTVGNVGTTEVTETTTTTTTTSTSGTGGTVSSSGTGGNETVSTTTTVNEGVGGTSESVNINISIDENNMGANVSVNATGTGTGTETMTTTTSTGGTGTGYYEETTTTTTGGNGTSTYYEETTVTTTTTTTTSSGTEGNIYQDDDMTVTLENTDCYMSDTEFQNLKKSVEAESFADDKRRTANLAAKNKCMTVDQIRQVAKLFAFSEDKMSFVKTAYENCQNKGDYYQLMDVFEFSDDKEELENFLNSK